MNKKELNNRQIFLLFEAYRRNQMADDHEKSKPLAQRWLGLGTVSAYRPALDSGLMTFHNGKRPPSRCMRWLVLTDYGIAEMKKRESEFKSILTKMKNAGYDKTLHSQYMLVGGLTR